MKTQTISLCMIVKDEEKYLEKCLQSVLKRVDEIIVVDTGSVDNTVDIAKEKGAEIFYFQWNNDFAEARNFSIKQAKMDYILVMDADEWLDENVDLQKVLASNKDHYTIRIKNELSSGGAILHPAVRLFKNRIGLHYSGKIHEHLNIEDPTLNLSHEFGDVLLHHIGYKDDIVFEKGKHERNLKILLEEVKKNPTGYNLYNLGNQYKSNQQYNEALKEYKKAFPLSKDRLYVTYLLYNMVDCLRNLGRYEEALNVIGAAIESFPNHTDFYFMQGRIYEEMHYYKDAEKAYKKCIELGEVKLVQTLDGVGSFLSYVRLGNIYMELGNNLSAFDMAIAALKSNKYHMPALRMYLELLNRTKIPVENIRSNLESIFPVQSYYDLKHLIIVLAVVKSPLLETYINQYKLNVSTSVEGISKLYSGDYQASVNIWNEIEMESDEYYDIILLSFLLKDNQLLNKCQEYAQLNNKEFKILGSVIGLEEVLLGKVSEELENIILFMAEQCIYLGEDDHFNYLFNLIANGSTSLKIKISCILLKNSFIQNAQEFLLSYYTENQTNKEYVELLADSSYKQNQYHEALAFYDRAFELNHDYLILEKMYRVYEKMGEQQGMTLIKSEIRNRFPLVAWAKK